jgi:hypothetical protein
MNADNYRAIANNMYGSGADGISSFNFQEHYTGNLIGRFPGEMAMLSVLNDPAKIAAQPRTYLFRSMLGAVDYHGALGMASTGAIKDDKIVLDRTSPGQRQEYRLRLCEQWDEVKHAYIAIRAQDLRQDEQVEIDVNGTTIPAEAIRRMWHADGRSTNIGRPLPPYSTIFFDLSSEFMLDGDNVLGVTLVTASADLTEKILIDEIDVVVVPKD